VISPTSLRPSSTISTRLSTSVPRRSSARMEPGNSMRESSVTARATPLRRQRSLDEVVAPPRTGSLSRAGDPRGPRLVVSAGVGSDLKDT
jgi:hypothetical protein